MSAVDQSAQGALWRNSPRNVGVCDSVTVVLNRLIIPMDRVDTG